MRIRTAITIAALLPAALAFAVTTEGDGTATTCRADQDGATVTVTHEDDTTSEVPVEYCEARIYAQCDGAVDPAGKVVDPTIAVEMTPDAPTVAFTEGGGCGTVDEPVFASQGIGDGTYQFATSGSAQAGSLDSLTFEAHFLGPNAGYAGEDLHFDMRMTVDGVSLFGTVTSPDATGQNANTSPAFQRITVPATVSDSGASVGVQFTVTGIEDLLPPAGPGAYHSVSISFGPPHTGVCQALPTNDTPRCVPSGFSGWVMGATEVPSGVTFNPVEPAATTIPVVLEDEAA